MLKYTFNEMPIDDYKVEGGYNPHDYTDNHITDVVVQDGMLFRNLSFDELDELNNDSSLVYDLVFDWFH